MVLSCEHVTHVYTDCFKSLNNQLTDHRSLMTYVALTPRVFVRHLYRH